MISARSVGAGAQPAVDRRAETELFEAPQREVDLLLVEQQDELVAQTRRGEVTHEVHGAAGAGQVERVLVHAQPVAALVADGAQDARRVLDEAQVVKHHDASRLEVTAAAEEVEEGAEGLGLEGHRHGVDREVAAREVAADGRVLHLRQGGRVIVRLRARRGDVDAQRGVAPAEHHHGRAELLVRTDVTLEATGEGVRHGDAVTFDGDVEVDLSFTQQQVAHGAAHQVDPANLCGHRLDLLQHVIETQTGEVAREVARRLRRGRRRGRPSSGDVGPRHHADDVRAAQPRRVRGASRAAHDGHPAERAPRRRREPRARAGRRPRPRRRGTSSRP